MSTARPNRSIVHGVECLQYLFAAGHPVGSREMSRFLGVEHTKVNRTLGTLELLGLAKRTGDGKYAPGPAIHVLAAQSLRASPLLASALPHLAGLHADGFTVALGVLWREQVVYLLHARPGTALEDGIGTHALWPARSSSLGVVLLATGRAGARPPDRDEIPPEARGPLAARDPYLAIVRRTGVARLRFGATTVSLAVPIAHPAVGAIGVSKERLGAAEVGRVVKRLRECAAHIASTIEV